MSESRVLDFRDGGRRQFHGALGELEFIDDGLEVAQGFRGDEQAVRAALEDARGQTRAVEAFAFEAEAFGAGQDVLHRDDLPALGQEHRAAVLERGHGRVLVVLAADGDALELLGRHDLGAPERQDFFGVPGLGHEAVHAGFEAERDELLVERDRLEPYFLCHD